MYMSLFLNHEAEDAAMKKKESEKLQNLKHFCEQEAVKKILIWVFEIAGGSCFSCSGNGNFFLSDRDHAGGRHGTYNCNRGDVFL